MQVNNLAKPLQLTAYWKSASTSRALNIKDLNVQVYIAGIDSRFGFPRICDETRNVFVFENNEILKNKSDFDDFDADNVLNLSGECFDVTLNVRLFKQKWFLLLNNQENSQNFELNTSQVCNLISIKQFIKFFDGIWAEIL